jgi:hypothetical protein
VKRFGQRNRKCSARPAKVWHIATQYRASFRGYPLG